MGKLPPTVAPEAVARHLLIEEQIHHTFCTRGLTLSTAESCTGGALAALLTTVPGASDYFLGGVVTYSNVMKRQLLGVDGDILEREGAVSRAVVEQMVGGLLKLTNSDIGIAVSGIAGPSGGTREKPVGTVWAALGIKGKSVTCWKMHLNGTRKTIIDEACRQCLLKVVDSLENR